MAGASLTANFDVVDALRGLRGMQALARDTAPLTRVLGVYLAQSTRERFNTGRDPAGSPWAALSPAYAAMKGPGRTLVGRGMSGGLQGSITFRAEPGRVVVGSNKIYAGIHQFGGSIVPKNGASLVFRLGGRLVHARSVRIPARPYLGISAEDRGELTALAEDFLARLLRR